MHRNIFIHGLSNCLAKRVKILGGMKCRKLFAPIPFDTWTSSIFCKKLEKSQFLLKLLNSSGKGGRRVPSKNCDFCNFCDFSKN